MKIIVLEENLQHEKNMTPILQQKSTFLLIWVFSETSYGPQSISFHTPK